ncbi:MAG: hypothetical protein AAGK47_06375, partial [Bacteroidota bacterium]
MATKIKNPIKGYRSIVTNGADGTVNYHLLLFQLLATVAVISVSDHIFFWDTIQLGSKHAHWYYEQQFGQLLLPEVIDSGHPPLFGMYLALCWLLFGKTLLVSHLSMLPFVWISIWTSFRLAAYYGSTTWAWGLLLLLFVDPTFAAQHLLVSPDIVVVAMFMLAWSALLSHNRPLQIIALVALAGVSMRGMMVVMGLFLFECWIDMCDLRGQQQRIQKQFSPTYCAVVIIRKIFTYIPAGLLALSFLVWHYQATGWIGYHADSTWAPSFAQVDFIGFLKNIVMLVWRLADFGRLLVWISLLLGLFWLYRYPRHAVWHRARRRQLVVMGIILFVMLTPSFLLHQHLSAHRYLLPIMVWGNIFAYHVIVAMTQVPRFQFVLALVTLLGLATGNFWIYPKHISQGWDATLAHLPH